MSRGFDGFEIDDFRDSGLGWGRDRERDRSPNWNSRLALHNIHREEERADKRDREGREHSDRERLPLAREERIEAHLSERGRTEYADRNKEYSLRSSEIHTLGEVGILPPGRRLGLRQSKDAWQATVLARNTAEVLRKARGKTLGHHEANWLALVPQDVCNASEGQR